MTSDRELDELIRRSRRSFIAGNDAGFDFQAGLADIRVRASRLPGSDPSGVPDALAMLAADLRNLAGDRVRHAAQTLLRVRDQLLAGSLSGAAAAAAFATVREALRQAGLMAAGDEDFAARLDQLEHAVISLLPRGGGDDDPGQARANRHRRDDPPPGQRRAGGSSS